MYATQCGYTHKCDHVNRSLPNNTREFSRQNKHSQPQTIAWPRRWEFTRRARERFPSITDILYYNHYRRRRHYRGHRRSLRIMIPCWFYFLAG